MRFGIVGDLNKESGVSEVLCELSGPAEWHFAPRQYGDGLRGIGVVLMCRDASLKFKQRIRHSKKEKMLYLDVMLDIDQLVQSTHEERRAIVIESLLEEVPNIVRKYAIKDFDEARFLGDLNAWLTEAKSVPIAGTRSN